MTGKVIDFDRWRAERDLAAGAEQDTPVFRIGGKEYPLPIEPPATIALDVIRLKETMKDADAAVPLTAFIKIGNAMFGEAVFRTILEENHVGAAEMGDVILMAFGAWELQVDAEEKPRPNRQTRRRKRSTS
jgi:hypothetical protein